LQKRKEGRKEGKNEGKKEQANRNTAEYSGRN